MLNRYFMAFKCFRKYFALPRFRKERMSKLGKLTVMADEAQPKIYDNDDKQRIVDFCINYIKHNGYVRVGWAVDRDTETTK
jgi:hypothetical protein